MLQAHDEVLKQREAGDVNPYQHTNGVQQTDGGGSLDRSEKLTRVRLVQFHKNPNEPMVGAAQLMWFAQCRWFARAYILNRPWPSSRRPISL